MEVSAPPDSLLYHITIKLVIDSLSFSDDCKCYDRGIEKFVGTCFIGVSPEFEFALYTMAFLTGDEENHVTLDVGNGEAFDLNINCHKYDNHVGSCYVEALAHHD